MGYMVNPGWTLKQEIHDPTDDNFAFEVEVQLSDHQLTPNDTKIDVNFAIKFNEIIIVGEILLFLTFYCVNP